MTAAGPRRGGRPVERILSLLQGVQESGEGYRASCPSPRHRRGDKRPSLSIAQTSDGAALLRCFGGCTVQEILGSIELETRDLFPDQGRRNGDGGGVNHANGAATVQPRSIDGCTLDEYAAAKQIPKEQLQCYGLSEIRYLDRPALRIPYFAIDGSVAGVRFRVSLRGENRFRWRKGDKAILYGLSRLAEARDKGFVVVPEGESDCHTLWHHGIPAVGLPGASNWKEERDAPLFDQIPTIYVVREPDGGGEAVDKWLASSRIRDRVRLLSMGDLKDPSGLYLDAPDGFKERFQAALDAAVPWSEVQAAKDKERESRVWDECAALAKEPSILDCFVEALARAGVVGEDLLARLLFLIFTSRLLTRPASAVVKGPSSSGKSYIIERISEFFPASAYYAISSMSERALAYSDEPVAHRVMIMYEAAGLVGEFATYLMRSLLSEGRIRYETVEKSPEGLRARLIVREGPTSLVTTTTAVNLHPENETRLISLSVADTPEQTQKIMQKQAEEVEASAEPLDLSEWHALQEWLAGGPTTVAIPYARTLADLIPPLAVRLRRDFPTLLTLIQTHALLHRSSRHSDELGRIIASLEDYRVVRALVADLIADGVGATVTPTVRETVKAVERLLRNSDNFPVQVKALAEAVNLDESAASRRAKVAVARGYLKNLEEGRGKPARLVLGDPLPEDQVTLPTVETLRERLHGCAIAERDPYPPPRPRTGSTWS